MYSMITGTIKLEEQPVKWKHIFFKRNIKKMGVGHSLLLQHDPNDHVDK